MLYLLHILILVVSCLAIAKGADWLVESAARIAKKFGISELVIGLTVVAFGTSAPEFAVSVGQAVQGNSTIALGNVIGSNVFNLGFILGGCAAVRAIITTPTMVYRDGGLLIAATSFIAIAMYDGELSRIEGVIMMVALASYLFYLWKKRAALDDEELPDEPATWVDPILFGVGPLLRQGNGGERLGDQRDDRRRRHVAPGVRHLDDRHHQGALRHQRRQPHRQ
jgi:cation:H+ antiporter